MLYDGADRIRPSYWQGTSKIWVPTKLVEGLLKFLKRKFIFHFRRTEFLEITTNSLGTHSRLIKQLKPEIHLRIHVAEVYSVRRTQNLLIIY